MKAVLFLSAILASLLCFAREKKIIFHANGKVQYEYEVEGFVLDGKFACYYETGKLRVKGQFTANQKTGTWRFWDEKGLLRSERNYKNNLEFTLVREYDSTGARINALGNSVASSCEYKDYLFSHRYLSAIPKDNPVNAELFAQGGLIDQLLQNVAGGGSVLFTEDRFVEPRNKETIACYDHSKVVSVLVKETYYWCSKEQTLNNKVLGICPVVMEKGKPKGLGWFYVPDIQVKGDMLSKLQNHEYASLVTKTTVNDAAFKMRDVTAKENDLLRLMLIEFEANAILYTIDYDQALATNQ